MEDRFLNLALQEQTPANLRLAPTDVLSTR